MLIKSIKLNNFKCFKKEIKFSFSNITLIKGDNGTGKTTLALDSLLFGLFGYSSSKSLSDLINKSKKSCKVEIEILKDKDLYLIIRTYPTKLEIYKNNEKLKFVNSKDAQSYLNKLFRNVEHFRKFRMIDNIAGINFLEEGNTSLKKTLLSTNQGIFNNIRQRLLDKKRERETFNKDKNIQIKHHPSQIRLDLINTKLGSLEDEMRTLQKDLLDLKYDLDHLYRKQGQIEGKKNHLKNQKDKIYQYNNCPTCEREIDDILKNDLVKVINNQIIELNGQLQTIETDIKDQSEAYDYVRQLIDTKSKKYYKLTNLSNKLETRMKFTHFKYTDKDVLIIKKAIEQIDGFYSYFITKFLQGLEPIINSVIEKIGFKVNFIVEKNDFNISLSKDGEYYNYKDLSNGQKLILSIAFKIALLLNDNEEGLIIADEGFSSLDQKNLEHIFELFSNLPFQLICILHRANNISEEIKVIELGC